MERLRRTAQLIAERMQSRRWAIAVLAMLFLGLAVDSSKILKGSTASFRSRSDFEDYFEAAHRLRSGEDLYLKSQMDRVFTDAARLQTMTPEEITELLRQLKGVGAYLYPPFFAWMLGPLTFLEYRAAAIIYQTLMLLLLAASLLLLYSRTRSLSTSAALSSSQTIAPSGQDRGAGAVLLGALLYFSFLDDNAANGNVGFLLFFLCVAGMLLSLRGTREGWEHLLGGFLIGLAAAIKIIPGFLAGVLFAGRRRVSLAGFVLGVAFAVLAPAFTLGWSKATTLHMDWYAFLIQTYEKFSVVRPYANNQTISAALSKLFVPGSDLKQMAYGLPFAVVDDQLLIVSVVVRGANRLFIGVLGMLLVATAWRRPIRDLSDPALSRLLSLTLLTALVTSGVSWYHTYAILILPLSLRLALSVPLDRTDRVAFLAPAVAGAVLILLPRPLVEAVSLYSLYTWIVVCAVLFQQAQAWRQVFAAPASGDSA